MSKPVYRLRTIGDLLLIPTERLGACLREIEYGINLAAIAHGSNAKPEHIEYIDWTDDGDHSGTLHGPDGETILHLQVTDKDPS